MPDLSVTFLTHTLWGSGVADPDGDGFRVFVCRSEMALRIGGCIAILLKSWQVVEESGRLGRQQNSAWHENKNASVFQ
jgi:hypothetical protein